MWQAEQHQTSELSYIKKRRILVEDNLPFVKRIKNFRKGILIDVSKPLP
jgi:hypothetical protein